MYDSGKIITGLVIFVAVATFPFFYNIFNIGGSNVKPEPEIDTPVIQQLAEKECVEPKEFMRAEHMQLLNDWRDSVVRMGRRVYVNSSGKSFDMSLQNTCLRCHSNHEKFCHSCHDYMGVKPYCWDCHIVQGENEH